MAEWLSTDNPFEVDKTPHQRRVGGTFVAVRREGCNGTLEAPAAFFAKARRTCDTDRNFVLPVHGGPSLGLKVSLPLEGGPLFSNGFSDRF